MKVNRGKDFEAQVRQAFEVMPDVSVDRLHDQTSGFKGSSNICDFIVYKWPHQYYIECKSCYGNTLSIHSNDPKHKYGDITNKQWEGLLEKSSIKGVIAGYIVWFIDHDTTVFVSANGMRYVKLRGVKSLHINMLTSLPESEWSMIPGKKKRVFFEYDMTDFLKR